MPHDVIMPALGMAQETGLIVAWHKAPGDAVAAGEVLFEVETDKATMEVEAGRDGYLAAVHVAAGDEAPVGDTIAAITAEKPEAPVGPGAPVAESESEAPERPDAAPAAGQVAADAPTVATARTAGVPGGRVLASPRARRLAAEAGLDLAVLAAEGVPQPYHAADLEGLRERDARRAAPAAMPAHLTAEVPGAPLADFLDWLKGAAGRDAVLAAFAAASLRNGGDALTIRVEAPLHGAGADFTDPDLAPLSSACGSGEGQPALRLLDLAGSRITGGRPGASGETPAITLAENGSALSLTLEYAPGQLAPEAAARLLDGFAARLEDPIRHIF